VRTLIFVLTLLPVLTVSVSAQAIPSPTPANPGQSVAQPNGGIAEIVASPQVVTTVQVGQVQVLKFRAMLQTGMSTENFAMLPIKFVASEEGKDVSVEVLKCRLEVGECTVRSDRPRIVHVTAFLNGVFGLAGVTVNIANFRGMFPARMDVTASQTQAQEGTSVSVVATSPVTIDGPVFVRAFTRFTNDYAEAEKFLHLPNGVKYGQRLEINTESVRPLSFRGRKHFVVEMSTPTNGTVAIGYGSSVTAMEYKQIEAGVDDSNELSFTISGGYNPSVDYNVVLLRGDQFRVELAQSRSEIFVYAQGDKTKIISNRGSLGGNAFHLPTGFYTVAIYAHDRSSGIGWNHSRVDALGLINNYLLK
jgi:hypothetical protein